MYSHNEFMRRAIQVAREGMQSHQGGPFGAVIVRNGEIVAEGCNRVTSTNDPTAHAEVTAIRLACQKMGNFRLEGCVIYTSCEPCPMCLGAIYWAGIEKIYYGCTKDDAAKPTAARIQPPEGAGHHRAGPVGRRETSGSGGVRRPHR